MNKKGKLEIFKHYSQLMDFFEGFLGEHYEIILLDVSNSNMHIVDIRNPYISGREIGDPISDYEKKLLDNKIYEHKPHALNHLTETVNEKKLKTSSFFVKDESGELIAMLVINVDMTEFIYAKNIINRYYSSHMAEELSDSINLPDKSISTEETNINKQTKQVNKSENNIIDSLQISAEGIVSSMLSKTKYGKEKAILERLSPDEKAQLISELNDNGLFLVKGSVTELAKKLLISENTVYRYIKKK